MSKKALAITALAVVAAWVAIFASTRSELSSRVACAEACAPAMGEWKGAQLGCYCDARWQRPADDGGEQ